MLNQFEAAALGSAVVDLVASIRNVWRRSHGRLLWAPHAGAAAIKTPNRLDSARRRAMRQSRDQSPFQPSRAAAPPTIAVGRLVGDDIVCDALRPHERSTLSVVKRDGPLAVTTLWRRCPVPKAWREETLFDLHRLGYVTVTHKPKGAKRQTIITATAKPMPPDD